MFFYTFSKKKFIKTIKQNDFICEKKEWKYTILLLA